MSGPIRITLLGLLLILGGIGLGASHLAPTLTFPVTLAGMLVALWGAVRMLWGLLRQK
ncbi:MAG: hypothetical protein HY576_07135 [candidate division NC10 bacterium]|nr:hypothetical protein [candidate division NC10 bacterium]